MNERSRKVFEQSLLIGGIISWWWSAPNRVLTELLQYVQHLRTKLGNQNNNNNNNKWGLYTTYLWIWFLIRGVHKNAITMKIYMSTVIKVSITIIFPYENSNNLRLVFSHCASAQCHRIIKSIILLIRKNYQEIYMRTIIT